MSRSRAVLGAALASAALLTAVTHAAQADEVVVHFEGVPSSAKAGAAVAYKGVVRGRDGADLVGVPVLAVVVGGDGEVLWQKPTVTGKGGKFSVGVKLTRPAEVRILAPGSRHDVALVDTSPPRVALTYPLTLALGKPVDGVAKVAVKTVECPLAEAELQVRYPESEEFEPAGELVCDTKELMTGEVPLEPGASYRVVRYGDGESVLTSTSNVVKVAAPKK